MANDHDALSDASRTPRGAEPWGRRGYAAVLLCVLSAAATALLLHSLGRASAASRPSVVLTEEERVAVEEEMAGLGLAIGVRCPDFTLPACAGGTVRLSDHRGHGVSVVFVRPGCPTCEELGEDLAGLPGSSGVIVVCGSPMDGARGFAARHSLAAEVVADTALAVHELFGARLVPASYQLDAEGRLIAVARGVRCWHLLGIAGG